MRRAGWNNKTRRSYGGFYEIWCPNCRQMHYMFTDRRLVKFRLKNCSIIDWFSGSKYFLGRSVATPRFRKKAIPITLPY